MSLSTISTCSGLPKTGIDGVEIQSQIFPFPDYFLHLRRQIKKRKIIYACGLRRQNGSRQRANLHTHGRKDRNSDSQRSPSITGQIMHSGDTGDRRPDIFYALFHGNLSKTSFSVITYSNFAVGSFSYAYFFCNNEEKKPCCQAQKKSPKNFEGLFYLYQLAYFYRIRLRAI